MPGEALISPTLLRLRSMRHGDNLSLREVIKEAEGREGALKRERLEEEELLEENA